MDSEPKQIKVDKPYVRLIRVRSEDYNRVRMIMDDIPRKNVVKSIVVGHRQIYELRAKLKEQEVLLIKLSIKVVQVIKLKKK